MIVYVEMRKTGLILHKKYSIISSQASILWQAEPVFLKLFIRDR